MSPSLSFLSRPARMSVRLALAATVALALIAGAVVWSVPQAANAATTLLSVDVRFNGGAAGNRYFSTDQFRFVVHRDSPTPADVVSAQTSGTMGSVDVMNQSMTPGTYTITIEPLGTFDWTHYRLRLISCADSNGVIPPGTQGMSSGEFLNDPALGHTFSVGDGSKIYCQFGLFNLRPIVRISTALGGARLQPSDQFDSQLHAGTATENLVGSSTTAGTGAAVTAGTGALQLGGENVIEAGSSYLVTGAGSGGTTMANYSGTIVCRDLSGVVPDGSGGVTGIPGVSFDPAAGHQIVPAVGSSIQCTATYTPKAASVAVSHSVTSSTKNPNGTYTVTYGVAVINAGERADTYSVSQALLPGGGASVVSGSWSGASSGTIAGGSSTVPLASSRPLAVGAQETFSVSVVYQITPSQITGAGASASNVCRAAGSDVSGSWGFHAVAQLTWSGSPTSAEACASFPMSFSAGVHLDGERRNAADQFTIEVRPSGQASGPSATTLGSGASIDAGSGVATLSGVEGGRTYTVRLAGAGATDLSDYGLTISCADTNGVLPVGVGGLTGTVEVPFDPSTGYAVVPTAGAEVACTVIVRPLAIGVSASIVVESVTHSGADYRIDYRITVTNTGERPETYDVSGELKPGAGAILQSAQWSGPTSASPQTSAAGSGTIGSIDSPAVIAASQPIGAGAVDIYTVTAVYRIDPTKAIGGSNVCPAESTSATNFGLRGLASITWRGSTATSDACAGFEIPKPAVLGQTGSSPLWWILAPALVLLAAGAVLIVRRRRAVG